MARGVALVTVALLACASALPPIHRRRKLRETLASIEHDLDGVGLRLEAHAGEANVGEENKIKELEAKMLETKNEIERLRQGILDIEQSITASQTEVSKKIAFANDLQYSEDAAVMQKTQQIKQETRQSIKESFNRLDNQLIEQRSLEEAMLEKVSELEVIVGDIAKIEH